MEERVINILLEIKTDIGDLKKGQNRLEGRMDNFEGRMDNFEGRMDRLETDVAGIKVDMADVKSTVRTLSDALLETSSEVKRIKGKG